MTSLLQGPNEGWCAGNELVCPKVRWCTGTRVLSNSLLGLAFWLVSFHVIAFVLWELLGRRLDRHLPSRFEGEKGRFHFAWHVQSIAHAVLITYLSFSDTMLLMTAPAHIKFSTPSVEMDAAKWVEAQTGLANAALIFLTYVASDMVVCCVHRLGGWDNIVHHIGFLLFGAMITYDCNNAYLAGWLLVMEISTIFLNLYLFFRGRLKDGSLVTLVFLGLTGSTMFASRFCGLLYVTTDFVRAVVEGSAPFDRVPWWHTPLLVVGLALILALQLSWMLPMAFKVLRLVFGESEDDKAKRLARGKEQ